MWVLLVPSLELSLICVIAVPTGAPGMLVSELDCSGVPAPLPLPAGLRAWGLLAVWSVLLWQEGLCRGHCRVGDMTQECGAHRRPCIRAVTPAWAVSSHTVFQRSHGGGHGGQLGTPEALFLS